MLKKHLNSKAQGTEKASVSRRKFLTGAAATTGAAITAFPMIAKAQGAISMRWQSTWPAKDIFHEYALDFAKKVNDMTGGDLRIEVLPAGAVGLRAGLRHGRARPRSAVVTPASRKWPREGSTGSRAEIGFRSSTSGELASSRFSIAGV